MFIKKLEDTTKFEVGGIYSYAFTCDSDSFHTMQVVSISETRKTAVIRDYYGDENHVGKEMRKKIYTYNGEECISAGSYSMAGSWHASERNYSKRCRDFDVEFMHNTEFNGDISKVFADFPTSCNNSGYAVGIEIFVNERLASLKTVSLSDAVKFFSENVEKISAELGKGWHLGYTVRNSGNKSICGGYTSASRPADLLGSIEHECLNSDLEQEYINIILALAAESLPADVMEVVAELTDEIKEDAEIKRAEIEMTSNDDPTDPEPTDPTPNDDGNGDYSAFDEKFKSCNIISVSFGGAQNSAEASEAAKSEAVDAPRIAEPIKAAAAVPTVSEDLAKRAHDSYSFSNYKSGSATAEYNASVAAVRELAENVKMSAPEEFHGEIDKLADSYAAKLAAWTDRCNRIQASCPSWAICGPAKYPIRKHEKQQEALKNCYDDLKKIEHIKERIENFKNRPIMSGDKSALERLTKKVDDLRKEHEEMKQANIDAKKQGQNCVYASYTLSNHLATLRTAEKRLEQLKKAKETPTAEAENLKNEFCKAIKNTELMRLQLVFDGKPDDETRNILKSNGFKWAPSQKAWQRQLNNNAVYAAKRVFKALAELTTKA